MKSFWVIALLLSAPLAHSEKNSLATFQAIVLEDNGAIAPNAVIYFYSQDRNEFSGVHYSASHKNVQLPPGRYRAYAGRTQKVNGLFDHYASPEVEVSLVSGESVSVILPLERSIETEMVISDTTRAKLNIPAELDQHLN